jgi:hypothetical protein
MTCETFFENLWDDYTLLAPRVSSLKRSLEQRGETVSNDHIAFRTFDRAPINLLSLERHILDLGYRRYEDYHFEDKKLSAWGYVHPAGHPRIFLSELETRKFSERLQETVDRLCQQVDPQAVATKDVFWAGRLWEPVTYDEFRLLDKESEYAAWVAAHGLRANHFTVSVNGLKTLPTLEALLDFVEDQGFKLNTSGGRVKGSPEVLLEQGSTLADKLEVDFADGRREVPTCYYEFARRYPDKSGKLYEGFVAASADKIFESTNLNQ